MICGELHPLSHIEKREGLKDCGTFVFFANREALHLLMQQGVMYAIDEIHYALCPGDMAPIGDLR